MIHLAAGVLAVTELLNSLRGRGIEILYSSDLVTPQMRITEELRETDPLARAREALGRYGLTLRQLGPKSYLVTRLPPPPKPVVEVPAPAVPIPALDEISVYGSRYTFGSVPLTDPQVLPSSYIDQFPGGHDDALRAASLLPGVASNGSSRPYIRGAPLDDVLVRFDGVSLTAPYHLKDFHSPVSAFDDDVVDRVDIYSGGYPVRYGTRSGGVIDITPPSPREGSEVTLGASLLSFGLSSMGRAEQWPVDWLVSVRHSSDDVGLRPINGQTGEPHFTDTLGRLRWFTENGSWTVGWLLMDDNAAYSMRSVDESAHARYRDEYGWLGYDRDFGGDLHSRTIVALTDLERSRMGSLQIGGFGSGNLQAENRSSRVEMHSDWSWQPQPHFAVDYGIEATSANAHLMYFRVERFTRAIANAFDRAADNSSNTQIAPEAQTYGLWSDVRRRWGALEAEVGLRFDGQHFDDFAARGQVSPRLNVSYDVGPMWRVFASWGHFTQAEKVEDWRVETPQKTPDLPELAVETNVGVSFTPSSRTRVELEVYHKHWSHVTPYFDNPLERLALLPDLTPDRVLISPAASQAQGVELSVHQTLSQHWQGWAAYSGSQVTDQIAGQSVRRSWDQPEALVGGLSWVEGQASVAAVFGWHSGWPRTPFTFVPATTPILEIGERNSARYGDYFSADLRAGWTIPLQSSELATWVATTNATGRHNACCIQFVPEAGSGFASPEPNSWFPRVFNIGFAWRLGSVR